MLSAEEVTNATSVVKPRCSRELLAGSCLTPILYSARFA